MRKISHNKNYILEYEGKKWKLDVAIWMSSDNSYGELRVYKIEGDVTTPLLQEALELEAQTLGLTLKGK